MDVGLLVLRLGLGLLMAGHGAQKIFRVFGGQGISGTAAFFASRGFRPGEPMAVVAGVSLLGGGLLFTLGLATPLAGAAVLGTMLVAGSVHAAKGLWAQRGGYELALVYGLLAAGLTFTGPGAHSLDAVLGVPTTLPLALAAIALGLAAGALVVAKARATLRADASA